jgi:hypothetical protein
MNTVYRAIGKAHHRTAAGPGQQACLTQLLGGKVVLQLADQVRSRTLTD